jgi:predicted MPP superfamily phosphohydrolase
MSPIALIVLILGAIGHVVLWVALVNRSHAVGVRRRWVDAFTAFCGVMLVSMPLLIGAAFTDNVPFNDQLNYFLWIVSWTYLAVCAALLIIAAGQRLLWSRHPEQRGALIANHTTFAPAPINPESLTAPGIPTWLSKLPRNEVLHLCIQEKQLAIPRMPATHAPIRIAHITDLHMSGRLSRAYFERVAVEVNALEPDLVAVTGDIVENRQCVGWLPATMGRLRAPAGVYYVLGNHDKHVPKAELIAALTDLGLVHLGGVCHELTVRDTPLLVAGNELPWHKPASDLQNRPPRNAAGLPLRIVLSHSPDQFRWAQKNDVDLMMAGHLHGGQVQFPMLGPIFSPSLYGVRYAAGVFTAGNTVMHVSRGAGSLTPVRYNCPPEIALLILQPATV